MSKRARAADGLTAEDRAKIADEGRAFLSKWAAAIGSIKTARKSASSKKNLAKAREKRWPKGRKKLG